MKSVAVVQPYVFPYLPYFQLIARVDEFWIFDDVQFIRRGWMNRNTLLVEGARHLFSLPVARGRQTDRIDEKLLAPEFPDALARLAKMLRHAYARAPERDAACSLVDGLAALPWSRFTDFAAESIRRTCTCLGIATPLRFASSLELPDDLHAGERILALCDRVGAKVYVNPIGGRTLYDAATFARHGVRLGFLEGRLEPYPQVGGRAFEPGLSILDLIANLDASVRRAQIANARVVD